MVAKKKAAGRRPAKVEAEADGKTQSAAERRAAEAELSSLVEKYAPEHQRLIAAMRKSLRKRLPTAHELAYEYENLGAVAVSVSPNEHGYDGVLAIRATADGVKLYFNQGKDLPDPEKLLKGTSQTRWIPVEAASTLAQPAVATLIDQAIARNKVPFDPTGRGAVVIQSTSAKTRRPR